MRGIEVRMAVMSHLSDAQEIGSFIVQSITIQDKVKFQYEQNLHINFAKSLLIKYSDNLNQEVSDEELDKLWKELCDEQGNKTIHK